MKTSIEPEQAIKLASSIADLARLLDVSRQVVQNWKKRGHIPASGIIRLMQVRPEWFEEKKGKE